MKIVIIDSGINLQYKEFSEQKIECSRDEDSIDECGHGTACCGECLLIEKDAEILIIKVLNEHKQGSLHKLAKALEYCYERDDISIICISISCRVSDEEVIDYFQSLIDKIYEKGILIIASNENGKNIGFPASLNHVMAIEYKIKKYGSELFIYRNEKGIYYGKNRLMPWRGDRYKFFSGNSSAVPRVAGLIDEAVYNPSKIIEHTGIYCFFECREKKIETRRLFKILREYYEIWKENCGCKSEEECLKVLQYIEEKGGILIDPRLFSTSDFLNYFIFCIKCFWNLSRRSKWKKRKLLKKWI